MAIDFRHSLDRTLAALARPQRIVRRALAAGTRHVRGEDDSHGALHRAASGATLLTQPVYALTDLVRRGRRADVYVRLGAELFAVRLVQAGRTVTDGDDELPEWEASRIVKVDQLPAH